MLRRASVLFYEVSAMDGLWQGWAITEREQNIVRFPKKSGMKKCYFNAGDSGIVEK